MSTQTTLVIGSTGKTGRRVAERLTARGLDVRAGSRTANPPFDWEDESTWARALAGVDQAYITYYPDLAFPGAAPAVKKLVGLAVDAGLRRLVLLSGRNEPGAQNAERAVQESGLEWTVIFSSFMNQNFSESFWLEPLLAGEVAVPAGSTAEPFIDADDLADIVVAALTEDRHVGEMYEVTGPRLLTFDDVATEISEAIGRPISYIPLTPDDFRTGMIAEGVPEDFATHLTNLFTEVLDGRNSYLADGVQRALGREPKDFRDYARETAAMGVWNSPIVQAAAPVGGHTNG